ncbi:biopolymer transporter ExbD [Lewinella sp. 4G2]|uniref:ExbD/TolR family protein n=1 Tax=Lewinella sp. 4G2 TaxID=1803372 RepID=UPI0007B4D305|nr:biopolymer transporter ExbD [Lewinella sp. 4G2]OAV46172.1 hypothetical protein A3850_018095 [Lewinella sp. 4G2]
MSNKKTRRETPAVNAGSMADIAFLLLIFFLVTTTIAEEKGVLVKLPEWSTDEITEPYPEEKVMTVLINKDNELQIEDELVALPQVRGLLVDHLRKPGAQPGERIVSLRHDRGTAYAKYLAVYDELKAGYHELWDELSLKRYGVRYDLLDKAQQTDIRQAIPMVISEAEPTEV